MVRLTNKHRLPPQIANYLEKKQYSKGDADASVTELLKPPLERVLSQRFDDLISVDLSERVWALFGTAVHEMLDRKNPENRATVAEERLFTTINGWRISGQIDVQQNHDDGSVSITDWKVTKAWTYHRYAGGKDDTYEKQLNMYAHLIRLTKKVKVRSIGIWFVVKDFSDYGSQTISNYPPAPIAYLEMPLWPEEQAQAFMDERVRIHREAEAHNAMGELPELCTNEERWQKPDTYLVYTKPTNTRPQRRFDNVEAAHEYIASLNPKKVKPIIKIDEGQPIKCMKYCPVRKFCPGGVDDPRDSEHTDNDSDSDWGDDSK